MSTTKRAGLAIAALLFAGAVHAQVPQYGPNVTLEQARKAIAGAEAEARRNKFAMAIAVVDTAGQLVAFIRMDNTQTSSTQIAQDKAATGAMYRRTTKEVQDALAKGAEGWRYLTFPRIVAAEGGAPIVIDGKIIGGIGVSGGSGAQDGQVATAGLDALK
jgi:glc operon protein GlcG